MPKRKRLVTADGADSADGRQTGTDALGGFRDGDINARYIRWTRHRKSFPITGSRFYARFDRTNTRAGMKLVRIRCSHRPASSVAVGVVHLYGRGQVSQTGGGLKRDGFHKR